MLCSAAQLHSSLPHMMVSPLNLGNRPLISLLNRSVTGVGSPRLIGVDLISKKTYLCQHEFHSILSVSRTCYPSLPEFLQLFCLCFTFHIHLFSCSCTSFNGFIGFK